MKRYINIACGGCYIDSWQNFDYAPNSGSVIKSDLLKSLPIENDYADVVYSSHFIEHIPKQLVTNFLKECYRIMKPGGHLRLVLPDWEELCSSYLKMRQEGFHEKANFIVLEMLDQCVRRTTGGELQKYYSNVFAESCENLDLADFVRKRTGYQQENIIDKENRLAKLIKNPSNIFFKIQKLYCKLVVALLPSAFREQNVSFTEVGERHAWMYDFYAIQQLLVEVGFVDVQKMSADRSSIKDFPCFPLDTTTDGLPRQGAESMYIEAVKP